MILAELKRGITLMKILTNLSLIAVILAVFTGCGKSARVEKKLGPAETITFAANSAASSDVGAMWTLLPKSYRTEINSMAHMIGEAMPKTIWDEAFTLLGRLGKILETKQDIILQMMEGNLPPNTSKEDLKFGLNSVGKMLNSLASSEMAKVENLKSIDLADVADSTLTDMMKLINNDKVKKVFQTNSQSDLFFDSLKNFKAELVSEAGNIAKLKVTDPEGKVEELELIKVEDKWIPKKMADEFKKSISEAKTQLKEGLKKLPEMQMQVGMGIGMASGVISTLENAKSADDFKKAFESLPINPLAMVGALGNARAKALEAKEKSHLKQIGIGVAMHFSDGSSSTMDGTYTQFKDMKDFSFDVKDYPLLFSKGDAYEGATDLPLACEKPDPSKDGNNIVFQDGHVEKIMGSFTTLDDVKKAIKAKGYRLKSE
jgi:prepilin-type processing-associated H-X9-DG protein